MAVSEGEKTEKITINLGLVDIGQIDLLIQKTSTNWKLERMARVDRNILRLAVYEILRRADVPVRVTLNEAVELGKKFGSEESSAFVNGVLDRIAHMDLPNRTPKKA